MLASKLNQLDRTLHQRQPLNIIQTATPCVRVWLKHNGGERRGNETLQSTM